MKVFKFWLITNLTDWIGAFVLIFLIFNNEAYHSILNKLHASNSYLIEFSAVAAIVPAIWIAIYAASNYELLLSSGVLRWTSPLNLFTGRMSFFLKTMTFSGATWFAIIGIFFQMLMPNVHFEWIVPILKGISETLYNSFFA